MATPHLARWLPPRVVLLAQVAAPWLALLAVNALFVLPAVLRALPHQPLVLLTPSGDLLVIIALCTATNGLRRGAWIRRGAVLAGLLLWLYMWPALIGQIIIRQAPLLYDLLFLLKHVGVLILDLWSWPRLGALVGVLTLAAMLGWLGHRLLTRAVATLAARPARRTATIAAALMIALSGLSWFHDTSKVVGTRVVGPLLWTTPALASNLNESLGMYQSIQRGIESSPYTSYREDYPLTRTPDIHLFLVESYGRILFSHPDTASRWHERMAHYEQRLRKAGWHVVSNFCEAPVSGGGSWLAEATLLTGIRVRYEAVFQHLVDDIHNTPNLVRFLDAQGYQTVLLAPKDRARPGIELENRYAYDTTIFALDLEYRGPAIGWGIIPDQYSLGFAHERVFRRAQGPIFTNFHMVSSHAPWTVVPTVVDNWRSLGMPAGGRSGPRFSSADAEGNLGELQDRLLHYKRYDAPRYAYMGDVDGLELSAYADLIDYDLEVLVRYLEAQEGDKLVILMGDHQPPLVSDVDDTYDVPMHALSRDPVLLEELRDAGFTDGMDLDSGRRTTLMHESMFSLLVRALVRCCTAPGTEPPPLQIDGIHIGN